MAIQMIALKPHRYSGKALQPGDEFFVGGNSLARLLTALGRAAVCPPIDSAREPTVDPSLNPLPERSRGGRRKKAEEAATEPTQTTLIEAREPLAPEESPALLKAPAAWPESPHGTSER